MRLGCQRFDIADLYPVDQFITSMTPKDEETYVPLTANVVIQLDSSRPLMLHDISAAISLVDLEDAKTFIPGDAHFDAARQILTFTPTVSLRPDTTYNIQIGEIRGIFKTADRMVLVSGFEATFTTQPAIRVDLVVRSPGSSIASTSSQQRRIHVTLYPGDLLSTIQHLAGAVLEPPCGVGEVEGVALLAGGVETALISDMDCLSLRAGDVIVVHKKAPRAVE